MDDHRWDDLKGRELPSWYDEAKLGVFLHWGLYSVPAWAPHEDTIQVLFQQKGPTYFFRNNPYAEWYANTMRLEGSPTWRHQRDEFGGAPYDGFLASFDDASRDADLDGLADLCRRAGARYVVLTTKHHDGFCLWPTDVPHPRRDRWSSQRDLVGDLTEAVRAAGMKMGLYYSGGYDWSHNGAVIGNLAEALLAMPQDDAYVAYADRHLRELIDRYAPSVLWNDIGAPDQLGLASLFSHYYDVVGDGVVNDRWGQGGSVPAFLRAESVVRGLGSVVESAWGLIPGRYREFGFTVRPPHYDFTTPEYAQYDDVVAKKWEATRGVGHSFGANHNERPEDVLTATDLVRSFVDIVAKNGNLLIGIGPSPDGTIPEWQQAPLLGLGEWLDTNGEAVFASRPWTVPSARTSQGTEVRFTRSGDVLNAIVLQTPPTPTFELWGVDASDVTAVRLLGVRQDDLTWSVHDGRLRITVPGRLPVAPAHVLQLSPAESVRPA